MNLLFKHKLIVGLCIVISAFASGVLLFRAGSHNSPGNAAVTVGIQRASLLSILRGASCRITFTSIDGGTDHVDFFQDFFNCPATVVPTAQSNVFLCVYDHDFDWHLIRIELDQQFQPLPRDSPIRSRVLGSTCRIVRVLKEETNDWNLAANFVEQMSPREFKSYVVASSPFKTDQKRLVASLRNLGDQGQYNGDVMVPDYIKAYLTTNR